MARLPLLLFDIDGTLLGGGDRVHGMSVRVACQELFGVEGDPHAMKVDLAGRTDRRIMTTLLAAYGLPLEVIEPRLPEAFAFMDAYVEREIRPGPERVLPGVRDLLEAVVGHDLALGLVTGNLPRIAELKLAAAGIWEPFERHGTVIGGFGDASVERNDLPPVALALAERVLGARVVGQEAIIIGDTPHDIACGQACGARTVGVATGRFSAAVLRECGADLVLDTLGERERFLGFVFEGAHSGGEAA